MTTLPTLYTSQWSQSVRDQIAQRNIALVPKVQPKPTLPASQAMIRKARGLAAIGEWAEFIELLRFDTYEFLELPRSEVRTQATRQINAVRYAEIGFYDEALRELDEMLAFDTPTARMARNPLALTQREQIRRIA